MSCLGGALGSNNEESAKRAYLPRGWCSSAIGLMFLVTVGERNACIFCPNDQRDDVNVQVWAVCVCLRGEAGNVLRWSCSAHVHTMRRGRGIMRDKKTPKRFTVWSSAVNIGNWIVINPEILFTYVNTIRIYTSSYFKNFPSISEDMRIHFFSFLIEPQQLAKRFINE